MIFSKPQEPTFKAMLQQWMQDIVGITLLSTIGSMVLQQSLERERERERERHVVLCLVSLVILEDEFDISLCQSP